MCGMRTLEAPILLARPPSGGDFLEFGSRGGTVGDFLVFDESAREDWKRLGFDRVGNGGCKPRGSTSMSLYYAAEQCLLEPMMTVECIEGRKYETNRLDPRGEKKNDILGPFSFRTK